MAAIFASGCVSTAASPRAAVSPPVPVLLVELGEVPVVGGKLGVVVLLDERGWRCGSGPAAFRFGIAAAVTWPVVGESPPHVDDVPGEQRPFEDVGPAQRV